MTEDNPKPRPYRPSNGSEGSGFEAEFCSRCTKLNLFGGCKILLNAFAYGIDDPKYPKQWVYAPDPTYTAFVDKATAPEPGPRRHKPLKGQGKLFGG